MNHYLQFFQRCVTRQKSKKLAVDLVAGTANCSETSKECQGAVDYDSNNSMGESTPYENTRSSAYDKSATCSSKECIIAQKFFDTLNAHDSDMLKTIQSPSVMYNFDGLEVLGSVIAEVHEHVVKSFPDFHWTQGKIELVSPGIVKITNTQASGTHTGAPYTFGPYEEIEATGVKVRNDPEDYLLTIDMETELISYVQISAKGKLCGPQGIYEQIGGLVI
jgi:hypothetical protein